MGFSFLYIRHFPKWVAWILSQFDLEMHPSTREDLGRKVVGRRLFESRDKGGIILWTGTRQCPLERVFSAPGKYEKKRLTLSLQ